MTRRFVRRAVLLAALYWCATLTGYGADGRLSWPWEGLWLFAGIGCYVVALVLSWGE